MYTGRCFIYHMMSYLWRGDTTVQTHVLSVFVEDDYASDSSWDYFWLPSLQLNQFNFFVFTPLPPPLHCFPPPVLVGSTSARHSLVSSPTAVQTFKAPTTLKLPELTAILEEQVNINVFSCCAAAGCKMALHHPFPPRLPTMCDGLIRNWYRRDNGCLVLCLSPTEILSLSAASTPSPVCSLALSSSPSWDSWPM